MQLERLKLRNMNDKPGKLTIFACSGEKENINPAKKKLDTFIKKIKKILLYLIVATKHLKRFVVDAGTQSAFLIIACST